MANRRASMNKIREVIRLKEAGLTIRQIHKVVKLCRPTISSYIANVEQNGLRYQDIENMSDSELKNKVSEGMESLDSTKYLNLEKKFGYITKELTRVGVTLQGLWKDYKLEDPEGYQYSQFCYYYHKWRQIIDVPMVMDHKAGEKMFVDFAGKKLEITDPVSGEKTPVEVFHAILGSSQLGYVEAVMSQTMEDWVKVNRNALEYFEGVPRAIVPDRLKAGVLDSDPYEPDINPAYHDFARHYGTVILPARSRRAKDKALAENGVKIMYTRIYAPLRNQVFHSLAELNQAIRELLEKHNNTHFQRMQVSRRDLYEETERKALRALPSERYQYKIHCKVTVQFNYHVYLAEDKHYYSVPWQYRKQPVMVMYNNSVVEIYYDNQRIALHQRDRTPHGYTTLAEHMPPNHRFYKDWSSEKLINWGRNIGQSTEQMIRKVIEIREYPEQAFKVCLGILNLTKKYGRVQLEAACKRALWFRIYSYKKIGNILKKGLEKEGREEQTNCPSLPDHENIRGKTIYN